ncbi:death on curing protein, Doc toxin [Geomicrobium sp. JCM 19037]|uniref:type II toxin-antitoxin system death-on-curing family toxin n=1 Tax=unclassified Geomicrobium TaxID=2628951 RepID=UPI00045F4158|nr:type II toxin-antitoxin system death-on-curing family toxin [Geomicrobium sp. JCM 19037]GAK02081.1 death on curing protein, Doc toxin [Geomicrobium sp. JCM 19037]
MNYVSETEVKRINAYVITKYSPGEEIGIKEYGNLDSALNRPKTDVFGYEAYPTLYLKCAALFHSLIKNHAFHNANKRTAFWSLLRMLQLNNQTLTASNEEVVNFIEEIAENDDKTVDMEKHILYIAEWIEVHSRQGD